MSKQMLSGMLRMVRARMRAAGQGPMHGTEVWAWAPILPVLSRQLQDAASDMESQVSGVCQSFHGMASKAMETVRNTSHLLDSESSEDSGVASVIGNCRDTMIKLLDRLERGGELSNRAICKLEQVEQSVTQVGRVVREVEQAAFANKIVALNARIEAAHLGDAGKGFEVVADEISIQAERSDTLTNEVAEILEGLVRSARDAMSELRSVSAADREWIHSSREDIHRTLAALERANEDLRSSLAAASAQSSELAGDIEAALINLQFQDRVNQRIQHVVESLHSMHSAVSDGGQLELTESAEERRREVADKLAASYTMNSERVAHGDAAASPSAAGDDVELF